MCFAFISGFNQEFAGRGGYLSVPVVAEEVREDAIQASLVHQAGRETSESSNAATMKPRKAALQKWRPGVERERATKTQEGIFKEHKNNNNLFGNHRRQGT